MSPVFEHGALRLYLLLLLEDEPRYGYELMRLLEDRFMGMYTPSAGTIYPRLAALEDDGFVEHDLVDGRKVYRLTAAGRAELDARRDEVDAVAAKAAQSAREMAREVRDEVRASVRDIRRELKDAVRDVRREERRVREVRDSSDFDWVGEEAGRVARDVGREVGRVARDAAREAARAGIEAARRGRVPGPAGERSSTPVPVFGPPATTSARRTRSEREQAARELRDVFRSLRADLEAFVTDVVAAARRHTLDAERLREVSDALLDAREVVIEALDGRRARRVPDDAPRPDVHDAASREAASGD